MADDNDDNICAHPSCNCPASDDGDYCSAYCEGAEDTAEVICDCGHTGCS